LHCKEKGLLKIPTSAKILCSFFRHILCFNFHNFVCFLVYDIVIFITNQSFSLSFAQKQFSKNKKGGAEKISRVVFFIRFYAKIADICLKKP